MNIQESDRRLGELILYISQKSAFDTYFGSTKLNKILYFSDFLAYREWDEPITGAEYFHLNEGPAPRRLIPVRRQLIETDALRIQPVPFWGGTVQHRPVNLRDPNLDIFKAKEIALVDSVIEDLRGLTASEASALSHLETGWKLTRVGETIEYPTIFLSDAPLTEPEIFRAKEIIHEEEQRFATA